MKHLDRRASPSEENSVWQALFTRQLPALRRDMCAEFRAGFELCRFDPARLPRHAQLSRQLYSVSGWKIETVPGLIPAREFFALVRERRFPSSEWIRHPSELEYTSAPDAFHDLLGHLPQLCAGEFAPLIEALAWDAVGVDDERIAELERLYWYTVEFGLVREHGELRAYGAGLASSIHELDRALRAPDVQRKPFDAESARLRGFESQREQDLYLVGASLEDLATQLRSSALAARSTRKAS